tara:strand:- start:2065 stop:3321 length:1257 start_codon:yes stop_codon:yes gene_type:complete
MAEENKSEFAQESATPPEKTELERIQERISNYKVSISPNTALFVQNLTKQSLESPTKVEDLDAYVVIRNELAEGLAEYQTQVQNAQRRMTQLQEEHVLAKQKELADKEQKLIESRDAERQLRKSVEDRLAQMEAVLKSHGISLDLNQDGVVGLQEGQPQKNLTPEELAEVNSIIQDRYANDTQSKVSRAFETARALNPEPTDQDKFEAKVEATKKSFKEWEDAQQTIELEVPEDAKGTEDFDSTVEEVAKANENVPFQPEPQAKTTIAKDGATIPQSHTTQPILGGGNAPNLKMNTEKSVSETMQEELEPIQAPKVRMVEEDNIAEVEETEEYEEVTIPTRTELEGFTKTKIKAEAKALGFDVNIKDTKTEMIDSFINQTEAFIQDLQDSGEFVSAQTDEEDNAEETDTNVRDGGYFN